MTETEHPPWDPRSHGVEPVAVVAVRIEGIIGDGEDARREVEYFHPHCAEHGVGMFESIEARDDHVLALELNWEDPVECPVCEVSIT